MRSTGFLVAAVIAVGLVGACSAQNDGGAAPDTGVRHPGVVENPPAAPVENVDSKPDSDLRFPGTTVTAQLTGYDQRLQMVNFELVKLVSGPNMEPYYEDVPGDGPHRLPLAPDVKTLSAFGICTTGSPTGITVDDQGRANQPCTKDQLVTALRNTSLTAEVQVDGQDRIAVITELYHP